MRQTINYSWDCVTVLWRWLQLKRDNQSTSNPIDARPIVLVETKGEIKTKLCWRNSDFDALLICFTYFCIAAKIWSKYCRERSTKPTNFTWYGAHDIFILMFPQSMPYNLCSFYLQAISGKGQVHSLCWPDVQTCRLSKAGKYCTRVINTRSIHYHR